VAILALDLGTTTGWALRDGDVTISGVTSMKNDRHSGGGMRFLRFRRWLDELYTSAPINEVYYEEVRRHAGTDAAHVYGGLLAVLTAWCEEHGIPYAGVPVGSIKKYAAGKGNAAKQAMIDAVQRWGYEPADDNEADAIALLHLQCAQRGDVEPVDILS
jgi:Holliday junction resolvasome RuvABC endonuclease subunit